MRRRKLTIIILFCLFCITKPGYIPYTTILDNSDAYIQHVTYDSDISISAKNVYIGSDVTNNKPQGPVVIEDGKTTIQATNKVYIKNGFKVKNGAKFEVK